MGSPLRRGASLVSLALCARDGALGVLVRLGVEHDGDEDDDLCFIYTIRPTPNYPCWRD